MPCLKFVFLVLTCFVININCLNGQDNRFGAGVFTGLNFSQINDDRHQGYDKLGLTTGLKGVINLKSNFDIAVEMAYNQRGSKSGKVQNDRIEFGIHPFNMTLSYYDIGIFPGFYFYQSYEDFYRFRLFGGLSYGRLASSSVNETIFQIETREPPIVFEEFAENVANSETTFAFGVAYYIKPQFGVELRHTNALMHIYAKDNRKFLQYFLTLRVFYSIL